MAGGRAALAHALCSLALAAPLADAGAAVVQSHHGRLETTLVVEAATVHLGFQDISFTTRLYNGSFPAPVIRAAPGDVVRIRLQNRLGPNLPGSGCHAPLDTLRAANATNLHIHGIYDDAGQDNTFVCVPPGEEYVYEYNLNKRMHSATLWYHPHLEGSSAGQLYNGMAGVFEVHCPEEPDLGFVADVPLLVHMMDFGPTSKEYFGSYFSMGGSSNLPLGLHNPHNFTGKILLTNGRVDSSLALATGELARLRVVNAMSGSKIMLNFGFLGAAAAVCDLQVLAWDGVYLHAPRKQSNVLVSAGSRVDLAVSCSEPGTHVLSALTRGAEGVGALFLGASNAMLQLHVKGEAGRRAAVPAALPGPPRYYANLRDVAHVESHSIIFSNSTGGMVVNGWPYDGTISHVAHRNVVQEWNVYGGEGPGLMKVHPYHQHMVHFQVVAVHAPANVSGLMAVVGDYRDTVPLYKDVNYTIRFVVPFKGPMMVHCHILKHEDMGMLTVVNFTDVEVSPARAQFLSSRSVFRFSPVARAAAALCVGLLGLALCGVAAARRSVRDCCQSHYTRVP